MSKASQYAQVLDRLQPLLEGETDPIAMMATIVCSSTTRSEIVVPVFDSAGRVRAVLDVDSDTPAAFDEVDRQYLEEICGWLNQFPPNRVFPC